MKKPLFHKSAVVYISGPMTGHQDFNYPSFFAAEKVLISLFGCRVLNPARVTSKHFNRYHPRLRGRKLYREYIRHDIDLLYMSSGILMLGGWKNSFGARAEHALAVCLNLDVVTEQELIRWADQ